MKMDNKIEGIGQINSSRSILRVKHTLWCTSLLSILAFLVGCSGELKDLDILGNSKQIIFATELIQTRSNPFTDGGANDFKSMGVYAANSADDFNASTSVSLMDNAKIERQNGSSGWYYAPSIAWKGLQKHSFFAYAPYNPIGLTNTSSMGVPMMAFTVQDRSNDQVDLLVAEAKYNLQDTLTGAIHLKMRHALTRIVFSARLANTVAVGEEIKISKIELGGIRKSASRSMDFTTSDKWINHTSPQTYTLVNDGVQLTTASLTQSLQQITLADGNLYLLPQEFGASSGAELTITYIVTGGLYPGEKSINISMTEILDQWFQGEAVRYILTIPNPPQPGSFTVDVAHEPWDNVDIDASISADPYLDITNISVSAYDAAATRVYYYTNIPPDEVSLDPIGKVGSSIGSNFNLKDEFYAIASDDSDGFSNFHKPNHGMGYVDIIGRNTSTAGERPNQGKYPLIIKLRAGKLVREITVQLIVTTEAAKSNTTPYVGTFHRWNETGERIVTWHSDKSWTATIEEDASGQLCIDRLVSPDFANNNLYSYAPRDAEGAKVDANTVVSGVGRIYFRVGWKSKTSSATSNRYARIKVTEGSIDRYIYCRQGEFEESILESSSTLFMIYNTSQPRSIVRYPSQVGMLYQWNRVKAWDPLGVVAPPGFPSSFETTFSFERSACPEGYIYPNQVALEELGALIASGSQYKWGYYADGFFDRRAITEGNHRVEASSLDVASAGFVFFAPKGYTPKSIFLTTGGDRATGGELLNPGLQGGYWTNTSDSDPSFAKIGYFKSNGQGDYAGTSISTPHEKNHAHSLRCVRPSDGTAWIVRFDANGGDNAPLSMTVPTSAGKVVIPSAIPTDYWREGYDFVGWNTEKSGVGTTYLPDSEFTPSDLTPSINTLYAKWGKDPNTKIDFRLFLTPSEISKYLLETGSYSMYNRSNILGSSNGILRTSYTALISEEKAYPNLKWSPVYPKTTWIGAYGNCVNMTDDGGGWRLPRFTELYLVSSESPIPSLKDKVNEDLYSASNYDASSAWFILKGGYIGDQSHLSTLTYRCVKELPR